MAQSYSRPDTRSDKSDDLPEKVRELKSRAGDAADMAMTEGAKVLRSAERGAEDAYAATKKFVEQQPMLALAGVAAFAFAVGALWKMAPARRSSGYGHDFFDRIANYVEPQYRAMRRHW